ncbi:MAG: DUF433 domain-containing protein [Deltaproteobacteria bacterium]|nr:DUF433 domain-containing protein [Deltaproteobacteria bacterium]
MIPRDRIEINPRVCNGRPVIKGTRVTKNRRYGN